MLLSRFINLTGGSKVVKFKDYTGMVFGEWKVLGFTDSTTEERRRWLCKCSCGSLEKRLINSITAGRSTSCGCVRAKQVSDRHFTTLLSKYPQVHSMNVKDSKMYRIKLRDIGRAFNLTEQQYRDMLDKAKGCCEMCGDSLVNPTFSKGDCVVDHNHATEEIRGLLCTRCNTGLGYLRDSPSILGQGIVYLNNRGHYGK